MTLYLVPLLLVAIGGALGAMLRHVVSGWVALRLGHGTLGTLAVNISGSFVIGCAAGMVAAPDGTIAAEGLSWLALVTGILGSYTTVSTFSLQTLELLHAGRFGFALANVVGSLVVCISAAAIGFALIFSFQVAP